MWSETKPQPNHFYDIPPEGLATRHQRHRGRLERRDLMLRMRLRRSVLGACFARSAPEPTITRRALCSGASKLEAAPRDAAKPEAATGVPATAGSAAGQESSRLYRFAHVKALSALLRLKGLHLTAGVAVLLPTYSVVTSGGLGSLGIAEAATLLAVVTGTIGAGTTLSWYCERIVGELSYRRKTSSGPASLRVSTLTMWGGRVDRDFLVAELVTREGFTPFRSPAAIAATGISPYPAQGFVPLDLGGKTYIFLWGRKHVLQPDALATVLVARALPFPE